MKVTFKTLKQQTFVLDLQENDLVSDVKKKIEAESGSEFNASTQKLIHSGKVMEDSKSLKDYKVTDSGFVVVMSISKSPKDITKEASASSQINPTGEEKPTPSEKSLVTEANEAPTSKPDAKSQSSLTAVTTALSDTTSTSSFEESSLVTGDDFERVIRELISMGFQKSQIIRAMRAGFNNPNRAFEYLSSGNIPIIDIIDQRSQTEENESASPEQLGDTDTPDSGLVGLEDPIAALASLSQFQQMRALVQANPELLPQIIQQIENDNTELFRFIQENEQAFLEFINTPVAGTTRSGDQRQTVFAMTAEERAAVDRLKALGFPEELVIQKDEKSAV